MAFVLFASQLEVGEKTRVESAGDLSATLTWSTLGRRGLAAPLTIEVVVPPEVSEVTVMINSDYLSNLDHNAWIPEPREMHRQGALTVLIYEAAGGRLVAELDSRFAPSTSPGRHPLEVQVEAAEDRVSFKASTWLVP
ncbi:MAG TPA: hypothetical protein VJR05_07320 [Acidimicrobiia bacterium]|nr:hypothetical protein [Acidimicrobiia bacterium]